jgi:hypothetical protein
MNADDFRWAIKNAAEDAAKLNTLNANDRARCFVANLSGGIKRAEPTLAAAVWDLLGITPEATCKANELINERLHTTRQQ